MKFIEEKGVINNIDYHKLSFEEKVKYWRIETNRYKLISKLTDEELQANFNHAQEKEFEHHNRYLMFYELTHEIEEEAKRRKLPLSDIATEYHRKIRRYKNKEIAK